MTRLGLIGTAILAIALLVPSGALGAGGTYEVIQCSAQNRGDEAEMRQPRAYNLGRRCSIGAEAHAMKIDNVFPAATGVAGEFAWTAPPQTGFVRVRVAGKLRRKAGHHAHLVMADDQGRETHRFGTGATGPTSFRQWGWNGAPQEQFAARLSCKRNGGCPQSDAAKTWVKNVRMTLVDSADPVVSASGSMLGQGWLRGERELIAEVLDAGGGVAHASVRVNTTTARSLQPACNLASDGVSAAALRPCPTDLRMSPFTLPTDGAPFREGENSLAICAQDFGHNEVCHRRTVRIDNTPPQVAFANTQLPQDPELVRVTLADPHSGIDSGQVYFRPQGDELWRPLPTELDGAGMRARADSSSHPEGSYEFRAVATDSAGNQAESTLREDGRPMVLQFPLRAGVALSARIEPGGQQRVTLPYGRARRAVGRLVARDGEPLTDREIRVEEYFGEGALLDRRIRRVATDDEGRWRSRLPPGPSRQVRVYYDGDARYLDDETPAGSLRVRSKAVFKTSRRKVRQGRRVVFRGRIARLGARLPNGGKLVELQVRERPGRWATVREAFRTNPRGRYRLRYRFGRFYVRNVRFRFRVKVAREADWPYRAATSRARNVTVLAR